MCGREEYFASGVEEVAARRLAAAVGNAVYLRPIRGPHDVLLVARAAVARRLKDQPTAVGAEIRLRVFSAVCELTDIGEVGFTGRRRNGSRLSALGSRRADNGMAGRASENRRREERDGGE